MSQIENQKPLVSVIIVNWNGEKWLKKCLDSLLAQTYRNIEVIFVDNASIDDSLVYVKEHYQEVLCIENGKNLGFATANNQGIERATGKYILLLNTDAWVENNFLERVIDEYSRRSCDVIAPLEARYDGVLQEEYAMTIDPFGHGFGVHNSKREPFYLSGACLFFSKALYEETGGLDGDFFMYFEETDWFWRLHLLKKDIFQMNDFCVYHAGAGSTGSGIKYKSFLWRNQNTLQMLLKNYAWYNLLWVLPIYFIQNIFEILAFLIFLKPRIAWSYIEGWWFNLRNLKRTLKKRRRIQQNRIVGDWEIMKKMYFGFGKAYHLLRFLRTEKI